MQTKYEIVKTIVDSGMVLIIRTDQEDEAKKVAEAAVAGGVKALEITMSCANALGVIAYLADKYKGQDIVVGAGTILDAETANAAMLAGARLLVSPNLNPAMIEQANRYQAVTISGAMTPTEVLNTVQSGADFVKIFPAEFLGPQYIKTIKAPLPQAAIVPTGGVNPANVQEWFAAGSSALGVGSYISKAHKKDGDYGKVTAAAREFAAAIKQARS
ncbi:bifunctional 4-hydroxy-2-oxoglutarate aldolase/2-dehydro-3-deoxy-phosphogluconate aldolase [Propionispora hippei]|uniref:2-dehydro-3-deoxyphosphogluconate aldolase / (4S)-4-hydroxy-2-oxoglutarate aldolase n=1 Tax=Propionispora hippei DSM 15287 TaxID=1123003 RepID=A0A1M6DNV6_9FIRM|nr:bifunctional 4-hydroxy-2-oxoglutarate aldolase/2-dehydro-3-deoxy-phosphogluconate aldolase [Propionispora hippei]SHI74882.1 2-dehydro-3-deoxyphosphogluconate aldolase / (4S)-4-hydroxy-2-oxoglutarate aldolase [Propionispora hippei DSM 15287]